MPPALGSPLDESWRVGGLRRGADEVGDEVERLVDARLAPHLRTRRPPPTVSRLMTSA